MSELAAWQYDTCPPDLQVIKTELAQVPEHPVDAELRQLLGDNPASFRQYEEFVIFTARQFAVDALDGDSDAARWNRFMHLLPVAFYAAVSHLMLSKDDCMELSDVVPGANRLLREAVFSGDGTVTVTDCIPRAGDKLPAFRHPVFEYIAERLTEDRAARAQEATPVAAPPPRLTSVPLSRELLVVPAEPAVATTAIVTESVPAQGGSQVAGGTGGAAEPASDVAGGHARTAAAELSRKRAAKPGRGGQAIPRGIAPATETEATSDPKYFYTNRDKGTTYTDGMKTYLEGIGLVNLLTAAEERDLSQAIERGREARARIDAGAGTPADRRALQAADRARERFITANLRLVVSVARRYPLPPSMELLDLVQEGNLGLQHAVDKFDWRKGFKFSTYATFWIRQAIGRSLDQKASLVRLPGDRSASLRAALRAASGDSDELDVEHARLHRLTTPTSLDRNLGDDGNRELNDVIPDSTPGPEDQIMRRADDELTARLLDALDARARYAVEQRFGLRDGRKRSYREVGEELGLTTEGARQLVKRAISAVREQAGAAADDGDIG